MSASRHTHVHELLAALELAGCPLCRLSTRSVIEYFASLGYEQVNDLDLRDELRAAGGFCSRHAWLFHEAGGNRLGVAIIYRDVLGYLRQGVDRGRSGGSGFLQRLVGKPQPAPRPCAACRIERDAEQRYRAALLEHLQATDVQARYQASEGLCLVHFGRALESAGGGEGRFLRQDMARRLDRQLADLDEYIRKHDYRFRHEGLDAERDAPRQSVRRVVGNNSADPDAWEGRTRPSRGPRNKAPTVSEGASLDPREGRGRDGRPREAGE
jgi:hypothetical protein